MNIHLFIKNYFKELTTVSQELYETIVEAAEDDIASFMSYEVKRFIDRMLRYKYNLNNYQDQIHCRGDIMRLVAEITRNLPSIYDVEKSKGSFSLKVSSAVLDLRDLNYKLPQNAAIDFCKEFDPFTDYSDTTLKHRPEEDYQHVVEMVEEFFRRYDVTWCSDRRTK